MKVFQLVYTQLETKTIQAPTLADAHKHAEMFKKLNPTVRLVSLTDSDYLIVRSLQAESMLPSGILIGFEPLIQGAVLLHRFYTIHTRILGTVTFAG